MDETFTIAGWKYRAAADADQLPTAHQLATVTSDRGTPAKLSQCPATGKLYAFWVGEDRLYHRELERA